MSATCSLRYEGSNDILLFEAKAGKRRSFIIRQLYFPFRTIQKTTLKEVRSFCFLADGKTKPPAPMILILGIVVAAVIYVATKYGGIGQAGLDLYGFVRDIDRKEASELLENIEKTHMVHLPLIPCQRWHWDVEKIGRP